MLATSWEQVEPTRWHFKLREGVKFHDGSPMDGEAVAVSINWLWSDANNYSVREMMGPQISAEPVDATTVAVITAAPDPLLPRRIYLGGVTSGQADPRESGRPRRPSHRHRPLRVRGVEAGPVLDRDGQPRLVGQHRRGHLRRDLLRPPAGGVASRADRPLGDGGERRGAHRHVPHQGGMRALRRHRRHQVHRQGLGHLPAVPARTIKAPIRWSRTSISARRSSPGSTGKASARTSWGSASRSRARCCRAWRPASTTAFRSTPTTQWGRRRSSTT